MQTIILGDIHNRWWAAERLLRTVTYDRAIMLGDYFDDYGDSPEIARDTALWLRHSIAQPNRIHLFGNHDVPYAFGHILCPGFTIEKSRAINAVMSPECWAKMDFHCWVDDWLLTHAGLHPLFCRLPDRQMTVDYIRDFMAGQAFGAKAGMKAGERHWFTWMGSARGGHDFPVGGITWLDFRMEFSPIPGLNQIVGHTPIWRESPFYGESHFDFGDAQSMNYCIDTLDGKRAFYAIIEDGRCSIEEIRDHKKWAPTAFDRQGALREFGIDVD